MNLFNAKCFVLVFVLGAAFSLALHWPQESSEGLYQLESSQKAKLRPSSDASFVASLISLLESPAGSGGEDVGKELCENELEDALLYDDEIGCIYEKAGDECGDDDFEPECCDSADPESGCGFSNGNKVCGNYHPTEDKLCICYDKNGPVCKPGVDDPDKFRDTLWEELFHRKQHCEMRNDPDKAKLPYNPVEIVVPVPGQDGAILRCSMADNSNTPNMCLEMNAKCHNPFDDESPERDAPQEDIDEFCDDFCEGYSPEQPWYEKACCEATCKAKYQNCCDWFETGCEVASP